MVSTQKSDFALDVCCGSGDLTNLLSKQVGKTGKVIGLDFSPQQLKIARQRFSATNINWMEGMPSIYPLPILALIVPLLAMDYAMWSILPNVWGNYTDPETRG